ncbi:aldo/keto reductase, partial [Candidatus Woesearchaeota archaeon]|nr:aldo/keto reductase [Candidatus Woesearchaeota archaeon]
QDKLYGYLIHDFKTFKEHEGMLGVLKQLKGEGKIEKIGFSLYSPIELKYLLQNNISFDVVQVPYSIFDQRFSRYFSLLKEKGVEVHIRSVFLQGLVFKNPDKLEGRFAKVKNKLLKLRNLSDRLNIPISSLCINFALLNEYVDKVIIGVDSLNNLKENIPSMRDKLRIKEIYSNLKNLEETDENIILPVNWGEK